MYQNNLTSGTTANLNGYLPGNGYYYVPPYGGYTQKEQSVNTPLYSSQPSPPSLKGRPVSSFEEARAATIDFDGSLYIFTDIGNKKIYTKQINLDGTATLNTYSLDEVKAEPQAPKIEQKQEEAPKEYITREEILSQIRDELSALNQVNKKSATLNNF